MAGRGLPDRGRGGLAVGMFRIISDLHLFDARTQVRDLRQIAPLLAGVQTFVLNGDTCEMRAGVTPAQLAELRAFFTASVPEVVFITGNHDPDISDVHEILAARDRVWILHGDVCLPGLTPWSRKADGIQLRLERHLAAEPDADWSRLDVRFRIARVVAREETYFPDRTTRSWRAHVAWIWDTLFPPLQVIAMLRSWRDLPGLAAELAQAQRPTAQVVVTGHVHFPGVWHPASGPVVVNTGSFFRPLGGNLVDVYADRVEVRTIVCRGGSFHPGPLLATIPLH